MPTVKVWETNYCRLLKYAAKLQLDSGEKTTLNDAIKSLLDFFESNKKEAK
jgi:hypothetical protein